MHIDTTIPVPEIHPRCEIGVTVSKMKVGGSIFVKSHNKRQQAANALRKHGWGVITRKYPDGYRVWRVA